MYLYEIRYYAHEDHFPSIKNTLVALLMDEEQITIKQSWENGYHLCLFGFMEVEQAQRIYEQLCIIQRHNPSPVYDVEEFQHKYAKVALVSNQQQFLDPIYQNQVVLLDQSKDHIFENHEQLQLYLRIHHILDKYLMHRYFQKNAIMELIPMLKPFIDYLPDKILNKMGPLVSNGYISHVSHYVGLLNSLNEADRAKVKAKFEGRFQQDLPVYLETYDKMPIHEALLEELISVHELVSRYVEEGWVNFFSPDQFETDVEPQLHRYHDRHAEVFGSPEHVEKVMKDHVLCTNKWVLNVWYEKLVLLNIKPIEKFYMNYFISRMKYELSMLEVG